MATPKTDKVPATIKAEKAPPGKNGGARAGAGRKPKAEKYSGHINKAEKRIADRLPELIDNLFVLAKGVTVEEAAADGEVNVYTRPPDRQANEYLVNRILGKPTERQEISADVDVKTTAAPLDLTTLTPTEIDDLERLIDAATQSGADPG